MCRNARSSPRIHTWKLRDPTTASEFQLAFELKVTTDRAATATAAGVAADTANCVETIWSKLKDPLLDAATEVCVLSKNHQWRPEAWWWNEHVDEPIQENHAWIKAYKALKKGGKMAKAEEAWRRPSSWSPVLTLLFKRNQASIPVLSAARVLATTPSSAHSASCGSSRSAAASLSDWWLTQTTSPPGIKVSLDPSTAYQWLKWMLNAPTLMWRLLSAIWVTCCALVVAVTVPLPPDAVWPGESSRSYCLSSPPGTSHLRCVARCTWPVSAPLCSTVAKHVAPRSKMKHLHPHYSRNMAIRILRQSFAVGSWYVMDMYNVPCPVSNLPPTCRRHGSTIPDSKVHGANMGPTWVLSAPGGSHVGPMNLAIGDVNLYPTQCWKQPCTGPWTAES